MTAIQIGRVIVKTSGREAGKKGVIVNIIDPNYVLLTGPKSLTSVRRRKCNIKHLEPTDKIVSVKRDATDEEVIAAIEAGSLKGYMEESVVPKV